MHPMIHSFVGGLRPEVFQAFSYLLAALFAAGGTALAARFVKSTGMALVNLLYGALSAHHDHAERVADRRAQEKDGETRRILELVRGQAAAPQPFIAPGWGPAMPAFPFRLSMSSDVLPAADPSGPPAPAPNALRVKVLSNDWHAQHPTEMRELKPHEVVRLTITGTRDAGSAGPCFQYRVRGGTNEIPVDAVEIV
jgi:hypothetical protein